MQAGWPADLPRGGVQGGGAISAFNVTLENNEGRTMRYHGERVANTNNTNANRMNTMMNNANRMNTMMNNNGMNMNNKNNNGMNMNMMNNNTTMNMNMNNTNNNRKANKNNNRKTNKNKNKKTNKANNNNRKTNKNNINAQINSILPNAAPNTNTNTKSNLDKIMFQGKRYFKNKSTGDAYLRSVNGAKGKRVGKFLEMNGKLSLDTSLEAQEEEIDIETEGVENESEPRSPSLSQNGGMGGSPMPACGSCPFPGTGACDFYAKGGGCGCNKMYRGGAGKTRRRKTKKSGRSRRHR